MVITSLTEFDNKITKQLEKDRRELVNKLDKKSIDSLIDIFQNDFILTSKTKWNPYNIKYMVEQLFIMKEKNPDCLSYFMAQIDALGQHKILSEVFDSWNEIPANQDKKVKLEEEVFEENIYNVNNELEIENDNFSFEKSSDTEKINLDFTFETSSDFNSLFKKQEW